MRDAGLFPVSGTEAPALAISAQADAAVIQLSGDLLTARLADVEHAFATAKPAETTVQIDLSGLGAVDTGGAWMIRQLCARLRAGGAQVQLVGGDPTHVALIDRVAAAQPFDETTAPPARLRFQWIVDLGAGLVGLFVGLKSFLSFFGQTLVGLLDVIVRPRQVRWASLVTHMQDTGLNAVPIVGLMGFLIGVVLAFQGAAQLKQFGAEVFVVELIAISTLRELGILLTAIIVAGRSGSAFTASVGSMKVQQEIDAMQTLGLDPIRVLVVPRVLALLIMLPVLGFVANMCGLFGGALMSWIDLGVSPGMFVTRLHDNTSINHLLIGMFKAPFFALMIGVVACWQAFQVQGSSTSVGRRTTSSVVQGIFLVIVLDALFSIFFARLGV